MAFTPSQPNSGEEYDPNSGHDDSLEKRISSLEETATKRRSIIDSRVILLLHNGTQIQSITHRSRTEQLQAMINQDIVQRVERQGRCMGPVLHGQIILPNCSTRTTARSRDPRGKSYSLTEFNFDCRSVPGGVPASYSHCCI
ncbi:hypothetical protein SAY86_015994 [Trapa natans]|uniref:Uncharacterized protein n=1 Tax=Trapa natans TaxID=22666 RepID=A0AAN7QWR4_TRANT|nr:hypothetical protein SAY86_015994 [Trapa natans]